MNTLGQSESDIQSYAQRERENVLGEAGLTGLCAQQVPRPCSQSPML